MAQLQRGGIVERKIAVHQGAEVAGIRLDHDDRGDVVGVAPLDEPVLRLAVVAGVGIPRAGAEAFGWIEVLQGDLGAGGQGGRAAPELEAAVGQPGHQGSDPPIDVAGRGVFGAELEALAQGLLALLQDEDVLALPGQRTQVEALGQALQLVVEGAPPEHDRVVAAQVGTERQQLELHPEFFQALGRVALGVDQGQRLVPIWERLRGDDIYRAVVGRELLAAGR